ncbi:MAG: hypothetical protein ACLR4Z_15200 [Butyricicoccaceae bacterium]
MKTLQGLCDGLAASTLIAWSRIIGDSLDRMRTAANRRVEAGAVRRAAVQSGRGQL